MSLPAERERQVENEKEKKKGKKPSSPTSTERGNFLIVDRLLTRLYTTGIVCRPGRIEFKPL